MAVARGLVLAAAGTLLASSSSAAAAAAAGLPQQQQLQGSCRRGVCSQDSVLFQRSHSIGSAIVTENPEGMNGSDVVINVTDIVANVTGPIDESVVVAIPCTIRDFKSDHPDFYLPREGPPGRSFGHLKGCVKQQLGEDRKPVFEEGGSCFNSSASFAQWYNDVPGVNQRDNFTMEFVPNSFAGLTYDNASFFPFDGKAWGSEVFDNETLPHNYWFTMEMHVDFIYEAGSSFAFRGDDDVWVFINGSLVMDLGGIHTPLDGSLSLDGLDLVPGEKASLDFFFAERQPYLSTFKIDMRLRLLDGPLLPPLLPERTCMIWGDPHVNVFDSVDPDGDAIGASVVNIYGHGDYWVVRSELISIQGRYNATQWSIDGQSATRALAIGGPFLNGHTFIVEAMDGIMTWDGEPVMQDFPSRFAADGVISAHYHELEEPIDQAEPYRPVYGVDLELPLGVRVRVNRWAKHLDVLIAMRQQLSGQDGHCGNFNLNATDDTLDLISARTDLRVSAQESLFPGASPDASEVVEKSITDCAPEVREPAQVECEAKQANASASFVEACVYDVCFGGEDFDVQEP